MDFYFYYDLDDTFIYNVNLFELRENIILDEISNWFAIPKEYIHDIYVVNDINHIQPIFPHNYQKFS